VSHAPVPTDRLDRGVEALIVVDMQVDFVTPGRPAAVPDAEACVAPIAGAAAAVRAAGGPVVWVRREYAPDGGDVERTRLQAWRDRPFVVAGSEGAALVPGLDPEPDDLQVVKRRWSAFFATPLDLLLRRRGVGRVLVAGVDLARCVRATVVDAIAHDYVPAVLADGVATRSVAAKAANLEDLADLGVEVRR
jgi:nicotinamidase-related amidase